MNTETTKFISFSKKDISENLYNKLNNNKLYTYEDTMLNEHLFQTDHIVEEAQNSAIVFSPDESEELEKINKECTRKDAAYFRIVEF